MRIVDEGTVIQFIPESDEDTAFLRDVLDTEPYQWMGNTLCVDHRYAEGVLQLLGMMEGRRNDNA